MTRPIVGKLEMTGINMDKMPAAVAADWWTGGRNCYFQAGTTIRLPGEARFANSGRFFSADVVWFVDTGIQQWWIYACARTGGTIGVGATDGTNHYNITPGGWVAIAGKNQILTIGDVNGLPFINHPELGPYWWNGNPAAVMTKLPGWPANNTCRVMRAHKNFLVALCMDLGAGGLQEGLMQWSSSADPGQVPQEWVPSATNDAGDFLFAQPGGPILDALSVRDQLFIAKVNAMYVGQYVGGQFVFQRRDIFPSIGIMGPNCWVEYGNMVYMLTGQGELVRTDGNQVENILYGVLQDYFRDNWNAEYPTAPFMVRDDPKGQVLLCYPLGSDRACTEAIMLEVATGRPGIRDLLAGVYSAAIGLTSVTIQSWDSDPQAWDLDTSTWNKEASGYAPTHLVFGGGSVGLIEQDRGDTFINSDGVPAAMVSFMERRGIDFDELDYRKGVFGALPRVRGAEGAPIDLYWMTQDYDDGSVKQLGPMRFNRGRPRFDFVMDGRLHGLRYETLFGASWELMSTLASVKRTGRST